MVNMSALTEPKKNFEGIDSDKENNVLSKQKNKTIGDFKRPVHENDTSSATRNKDILNDCSDNACSVETTLHQTQITDNHTKETLNEPDPQVAEIDLTTDNKAAKRKLKKLRRRLKKKSEKTNQTEETNINVMEVIKEEDEVKELQKESAKEDSPATTSKYLEQVDKHNDTKNKSNIQDDSDEEIDFSKNIPAFVHAAIKKDTKKLSTTKTCKQTKEDNATSINFEQTNFSSETLSNDNEYYDIDLENDFTVVKYKHSKYPDFLRSSEDFAALAISLILENQIQKAIQYLSTAISLDSKNVYHHANRSFCLLRIGSYDLAIKDANFVIKNTNDSKILVKANYLLGKAYFGLKNYEEAEKSMQQCLEFFPQDLCYIRELLRLQVCQLVNMGFCERDALLTLKSHSTVMDAMDKLLTDAMPRSNYSTNNCNTMSTSYDETEIFYSDDEDNCSNTQLLSKIIQEKFPLCQDKINKKPKKKTVKNTSETTCK